MKTYGIALFVFLLSVPSFAAKFSEVCNDLRKCAQSVSALTGEKYLFDEAFNGHAGSTDNVQLTKDNAVLLFTQMLYRSGFSRVPTGEKDTFTVMRQRDARDQNLAIYKGKKGDMPDLPENYDLVTLFYKFENPGISDDIARTLRSFMPANARIVPTNQAVAITDTAMNIRKLTDLLLELDVKPGKEFQETLQRRKEQKGS